MSDSAGALFYRVYLSRNLVIVAAGAIFLVLRLWKPLAILLTITAALPVFDMSVLSLSGVTPPALHPIALVLIAITAALSWRRVIATPRKSTDHRTTSPRDHRALVRPVQFCQPRRRQGIQEQAETENYDLRRVFAARMSRKTPVESPFSCL